MNLYPPKEAYFPFTNEEEFVQKGREWGLFGKIMKTKFWLKQAGEKITVTLAGYQVFASLQIVVLTLADGRLTCIHPQNLKEMQSPSFGKKEYDEVSAMTMKEDSPFPFVEPVVFTGQAKEVLDLIKRKQAAHIDLPEEKVQITASVKDFVTRLNHFSNREEEIVLFDDVHIASHPPLFLEEAWCNYSKTLKNFALEKNNKIKFEAKIVEKKFAKKIRYKIKNPSKIMHIPMDELKN